MDGAARTPDFAPRHRVDPSPAPQVASKDKDFRYMAASDLQGELAKEGFQVEGDSERRVVQVVLQQLEDPSGDIQNLAVKWCRLPTPVLPKPERIEPNTLPRLGSLHFETSAQLLSIVRVMLGPSRRRYEH